MELGPFAGLIYTVILIVNCVFFLILEWSIPREDLHFVRMHWNHDYFIEVCDDLEGHESMCLNSFHLAFPEGNAQNTFNNGGTVV